MNKILNFFVLSLENLFVDFDGWYGDQCVDLVQQYNKVIVGAPFLSGEGAVNIWDTYPTAFYDRIPDAPMSVPKPGDIVIWGRTYGAYGHIAICLEADINSNKFTAFSQNDPTGSRSIRKVYPTYKGVLGWLHPKKYAVTSGLDEIDVISLRQQVLDLQLDVSKATERAVNAETLANERGTKIEKARNDLN